MDEGERPSRIVGVLGGMGPAATADFYDKLIRATPARHDQEHLRVVIWADPTVPNRHEALSGDGADPTPWLEEGVDQLLRCGAEVLVCPCNTAHAFLPGIVAGTGVEFVSIIDTAVEEVVRTTGGRRVGLLAADGALASGLYQTALRAAGREPVLPSQASQQRLMHTIYQVKADAPAERSADELRPVLEELAAAGATGVVVGCTELSTLVELLRGRASGGVDQGAGHPRPADKAEEEGAPGSAQTDENAASRDAGARQPAAPLVRSLRTDLTLVDASEALASRTVATAR